MKIKLLIVAIIVVVVGGGIWLIYKNKNSNQTKGQNNQTASQSNLTTNDQAPTPVAAQPGTSTQATQTAKPASYPTPYQTPYTTPTQTYNTPYATPYQTPYASPAQQVQTFSVSIDDSAATPTTINVAKGTLVNLIVTVKTTGVYFGGLDLRSSIVNTGTILPGASKSVSFTANSSFTINAFWPSSGVQKASHIDIVVQ